MSLMWIPAQTTTPPFASARKAMGTSGPTLMARDLRDDVGRGAEAVQAQPVGVAGQTQGAVADQPGAEKRRSLAVRIRIRDGKAEALVGDDELRIAPVDVIARETGVVAEVLAL